MAQDLPDDVWREIAETSCLDREDLPNLSLASRRMHRIIVPVLFRYLEFHVDLYADSEFKHPMARLIRSNMRARFLSNSPELLRHTHVFTLWGISNTMYSKLAKYLAPHEDAGDSSSKSDAGNLLTVTLDAIFRLIFRMPGLRELDIHDIEITPLYYAAISSRPLLTTLTLQPDVFADIMPITPAHPGALRLRDFEYINIWEDPLPVSILNDIMDHCILVLESLTTPPVLLPLVVARIPLHHTLSLRSLTVRAPPGLYEFEDTVSALFKLLRVCPQLRHFVFCDEEFPGLEPTHDLLPLSLPNLSTISGPFCLLQFVTGGTNIVEVSSIGIFHIKEQPLTQVILSSPSHLRHLSMSNVISRTARELLTFIRSIAVFRNLEHLIIRYQIDALGVDQLSWKDHVSAQDSWSTIKDVLNQLVRLNFLDIQSNTPLRGYDIGCPISKQGDPEDRGHPSLEDICVDFICGMWSWDSRTGWQKGPGAVP